MAGITCTRVLIVAHRTADSPELIDRVAERAAEGPSTFTLLVPAAPRGPRRIGDPADHGVAKAELQLGAALPRLSAAAGADVVGMVGAEDPFAAVRDALKVMGFDEVIVSLLPANVSRWTRLDLPSKIRALGVPVIEVEAAERDSTPLSAA